MKRLILVCMFAALVPFYCQSAFEFVSGSGIKVVVGEVEGPVVKTAFEIFEKDYQAVFETNFRVQPLNGDLYIGTLGTESLAETLVSKTDLETLSQHSEGFLLSVVEDKLIVLGSDERGTAYGILELSRIIGVSPWVWWADSPIEKKENLRLENGFRRFQYPSVARRGIFINDEDWGLTPWSYQTYEPSEVKGQIGPKTHARIFELLLRLRANTFWPAMHKCSVAFYLTPGNREVADKYGIFLGSSHCEPMVRNTNAEWRHYGEGEYDYVNNRENVLKFWEGRVKELANSDNIYTLGMRGEHDGHMMGAHTLEEQKDALTNIIKDQRNMISQYVNPNVEQVSQVFIPYKEVLDVYQHGLEVPEDVTLMWTDDNYGYIRHFPDSVESQRKGGNGVYYHISYWGRPHDYLWLASTHPALVYSQMKLAYDKGARDMWIVNVGDIKPAEYLTELFLDMAWDITAIENSKSGLDDHLQCWLAREFGEDISEALLAVMTEYYRLAYIRKPEFMGNTRTEEKSPESKKVKDLPWSEEYIYKRLLAYENIVSKVMELSTSIPDGKRAAWFQLIEYPVRGAAEMNKKHLYAQLARHDKEDWEKSDTAFDSIVSMTGVYNSLNQGKWNRIMTYAPRDLAVYQRVPHNQIDAGMHEEKRPLAIFNGHDFHDFSGDRPAALGLGYERGAVHLQKGSSLSFYLDDVVADSLTVKVALAPNHPVSGPQLRYVISLNQGQHAEVGYSTRGRSEEWKQNVLSNQAIRKTRFLKTGKGQQVITIEALDEGVVVDQVMVY